MTAPVATAAHTRDAAYELHLVCCFADYLAAMWALKSYLGLVGGGECHLHLHLQGLAPPLMRARLQHHFPRAHVTLQREADDRIVPLLLTRGLKRLAALRAGLPVMLKLVDVALTGTLPRVLILDSDVLFFRYPGELYEALTGREPPVMFQQDAWSCYALSPAQARTDLNISLVERLNSGIVAIDRGLIDLEMCEGFLAHPSFGGRSGWSEQTLFGLLASTTGRAHLLPPSYAISMQAEPAPDQLVARHYSGPSRRWLTTSGMPWLLAHGAGTRPPAP